MATVIALACASLTYTSCTKDYSGEIAEANKKIDNLQIKHDSDVAKLESEISALKSSLSSLEAADKTLDGKVASNASDIATLKSKVAALETAVKGLEEKDAELKAAIEKQAADVKAEVLAKIDAMQAQIDELKAKADATDAKLADVLKEAQAKVDEASSALANELRSIVFVPQLYFDGVEAAEYLYATLLDNNLMKNTDAAAAGTTTMTAAYAAKNATYSIAKGKAVVSWALNQTKKPTGYQNNDPYTVGAIHEAEYNINPSSFDVTKADWTLKGEDWAWEDIDPTTPNPFHPIGTGATAHKMWEPVAGEVTSKDGVASVAYTVNNAQSLMKHGLSVMQLKATVKESGKVIASDYEALVAANEQPSHLAFSKESKATTTVADAYYTPAANVRLYDGKSTMTVGASTQSVATWARPAVDAIKNNPSVQVVYNAGSVDLKEIIRIHMDKLDTPEDNSLAAVIKADYKEYTLAEFKAAYGEDYEFKFGEVAYTLGGNTTSEDAYIALTEDGIVTPQYVVSNGSKYESVDCPVGTLEGISSVGRFPVVYVTLVKGENVILAGWFKMEIVKEKKEPVKQEVVIPAFAKLPYVCVGAGATYDYASLVAGKTTWYQFSHLILEAVGMDYDQFAYNYKLVQTTTSTTSRFAQIFFEENVDSLVNHAAYPGTSTICTNGVTDHNLGEVKYSVDNTGSGTNDVFEWSLNKLEAGKTYTAYILYVNKTGANTTVTATKADLAGASDLVWVKLEVPVAPKPEFTYGQKIANEWYADIDSETMNTIRVNVNVPNATTDPVDLKRDINHALVGSKATMVLTPDSDPVYTALLAKTTGTPNKTALDAAVEYTFSPEQPIINGVQLVANTYAATNAGKELYTVHMVPGLTPGSMVVDMVAATPTVPAHPAYDATCKIAQITTTPATTTTPQVDVLEYLKTNDIAKTLLNLWSYKETDQAKMLYANIDVKLSYGKCKIAAGSDHFHVRFVRPLDINFAAQDVAEESAVAGFNVRLINFIDKVVDWNNQTVVKHTAEKGTYGITTGANAWSAATWEENKIAGVNMYQYYQINQIEVDLANAMVDNWDASDLTKKAKLSAVKPNAKLSLGTITGTKAAGYTFTAMTTPAPISIASLSSLYTAEVPPANETAYALNYKNDNGVVETFNLFVPVKVTYSWGTINDVLEIRVKPTSGTSGN